MFTKVKTSKLRAVKCIVTVLALVAVLAFCLTACGKAAPAGAEYVAGTLAKSEYNQGETFDCTGAQIKITYDNGATEIIDVTAAMVGSVKLNTVGTATINVTYSTKGGSVTATIPVTVSDPYAAERLTALSAVSDKAVAVVGANNYDKGVEALLADAKAAIAEATTKAAIDAIVNDFETDAQALVDKKAAAVESMNELLEAAGLFEQFETHATSALDSAMSDLKLALNAAVVDDIVNVYAKKVASLIAEQAFYDAQGGQTDQKIVILEMIEMYQYELINVIALVSEKGDPATKQEKLDEYEALQNYLNYQYKDVILTVNLTGRYNAIKSHYEEVMRTPIDDIYELLAAEQALQIVPAPYVNGTLGTDKLGELLAALDAKKADAVTELGSEITEAWMAAHIAEDANNSVNLTAAIEDIRTLYIDLKTRQGNASGIVADIENITDATTRAEIEAIWADLKTWGDGYFFGLSVDNSMLVPTYYATYSELYNNLAFEKVIADGIVEFTIVNKVSACAWTEYSVDQAHLVTYYIPNLQKLIDASIMLDVAVFTDIVDDIPAYIIYSTDAAIDANNRITAAEAAREAFIDKYSEEIYNEYALVDGVDVLKKAILDAREEHNGLIADANAVIALIDALPSASEILIKDYKGGKGSKLYDAYEAYKAFAIRNSDETTKYTDVIAVGGQETALLDCVDAYVALEFVDEKATISYIKIHGAAITKLGTLTPDTDASFREKITIYADEKMAEVNAIVYDDTLAGGKDNFNRIEVLTANLAKVTEAANALAAKIAAAQTAADLT